MSEFASKNLNEPDETICLANVDMKVVDLGDITVAKAVHQPGWRWSTHVRPTVGGDWCQVRHVGVVISGRLGFLFSDGASYEVGPDDVYDVPPGHDGYVIGHEEVVMIEWAGIRAFAGFTGGLENRVLATLLYIDLVDASSRAADLGDAAWKEFLSTYMENVRGRLEQFRGTEISTTGSGMLVTFSGAAQALRCAQEIWRIAREGGLNMRAGVHVGEVELVGTDIRGAAVHEAERIMESAGGGEILVSETTRTLALASGLRFEDRGTQSPTGLDGEWHLYEYVTEGA